MVKENREELTGIDLRLSRLNPRMSVKVLNKIQDCQEAKDHVKAAIYRSDNGRRSMQQSYRVHRKPQLADFMAGSTVDKRTGERHDYSAVADLRRDIDSGNGGDDRDRDRDDHGRYSRGRDWYEYPSRGDRDEQYGQYAGHDAWAYEPPRGTGGAHATDWTRDSGDRLPWWEDRERGPDRDGDGGSSYLGVGDSLCWKHLSEKGCGPGCEFIHIDRMGMGWCPSEQQKSLLAQRVRKLANVKWNWSKIDSFELDRKIFDQWSGEDRRAPHWSRLVSGRKLTRGDFQLLNFSLSRPIFFPSVSLRVCDPPPPPPSFLLNSKTGKRTRRASARVHGSVPPFPALEVGKKFMGLSWFVGRLGRSLSSCIISCSFFFRSSEATNTPEPFLEVLELFLASRNNQINEHSEKDRALLGVDDPVGQCALRR
jgi:hypothetical protein